MASSILPSRSAPATAGAKARDCLRAALNAIQRSIITPIDQPDMMNRMMTTILATNAHLVPQRDRVPAHVAVPGRARLAMVDT